MTTHALEGVIRAIFRTVASTAGGATYVDMKPATGCLWEILYGWTYQDDGNVDMGFKWVDPDQAEFTLHQATCAANVKLYLGQDSADKANQFLAGPVLSTSTRYFRAYFMASAASKNAYCCFMVREYRGVAIET